MDDAMMEDLRDRTERMQVHIERLQKEQPGLPSITYIIMANDAVSAERVDALFRRGEVGWRKAMWMVGSYSRMNLVLGWANDGLLARVTLLNELPALWSGSDPDDTDPRFLELWREAWVANDRQTVTDGTSLPKQRVLTVYRGQRPGDHTGIAWSLDEMVARKFAGGASFRAPINGTVYEGRIPANLVMGYMTGRGEDEVILCPADLLT